MGGILCGNVQAVTPDSDEQFAEWYVWAKREVSSEPRVCLGVAQAAVEAEAAGADRPAAEAAARKSVAGLAVGLRARVSPWRQGYAQWYDWARLELHGDPARLHRLAHVAIDHLKAEGDPGRAAEAARAAAAADPLPGGPPAVPAAWVGGHGAQTPPPAATAPPRPLTFEPVAYAGFWRRLGAGAIDALICVLGAAVVYIVVQIFVDISFVSTATRIISFGEVLGIDAALIFILEVLLWLYNAGLESAPGQATLGKRLLGLVVIDRYGRPIKFGRASGRHFAKAISGVIAGFGFWMIGWTPQKQGLHDIMASTLVMRRAFLSRVVTEAPPPPPPGWADPAPAITTGVGAPAPRQ